MTREEAYNFLEQASSYFIDIALGIEEEFSYF